MTEAKTKETKAAKGKPVKYIAIAPGYLGTTFIDVGEGFIWDGPKGDWMKEFDADEQDETPVIESEPQGTVQLAVVRVK